MRGFASFFVLSVAGLLQVSCSAPIRKPVASGANAVDVGATYGIERVSERCVWKDPSKLQKFLAMSSGERESQKVCANTTVVLPIRCSSPCEIIGGETVADREGSVKITGPGWVGVSFNAPGDHTVRVGQTDYSVRVRSATALRAQIWQDEDSLEVLATVMSGNDVLEGAFPEIFVDGETTDSTLEPGGLRATFKRRATRRRIQIYYKDFYVESSW